MPFSPQSKNKEYELNPCYQFLDDPITYVEIGCRKKVWFPMRSIAPQINLFVAEPDKEKKGSYCINGARSLEFLNYTAKRKPNS